MATGDNWRVIGSMLRELKKGTKWRARSHRRRVVRIMGTSGTSVKFKVLRRAKGRENRAVRDRAGDEKEMSSMAFINSYRPV